MNDRTTAALIGALFIGATSTIPPINFLNACCCSLVIAGGMLASYFRVKWSPTRIRTGEGALVGLMAGAFGAVVAVIFKIPIDIVLRPVNRQMMERLLDVLESYNVQLPPNFREQFMEASMQNPTVASLVVSLILSLIVFCAFGPLGGMLGVALFEKRPEAPPPAPTGPPSFDRWTPSQEPPPYPPSGTPPPPV